ncbi:hypothetical protein [Salisediminibacterium selenitireducens]|uniref:Uncharacterized protein n=1 Tax=Bacillus selenitireducens (strain ATCC 700615 / DSM 15326 / MLS10) TaxID=439292 RepID=D6XT13_BACIE|nr:hypothetical protein [Salisediminibacterium selenitireducens]ADH98949.1 hypothetical protein Bsel_1437 [[Bacillus] selenitireducens MLS10]
MTTLVFFFIGWALLFVLLLLLPSIFNRKVTATLAGISGLLALFVIATEMFVSWQMAVGAGLLLTVVTSFLTARRVEVLDDEIDGEESAVPALYEPVSRRDPEPDPETESAVQETGEQANDVDASESEESGAVAGMDETSQSEAEEAEEASEPQETPEMDEEDKSTMAEVELASDPAKGIGESPIQEEEEETPDEAEGEIPRRFVVEADEEDHEAPSDADDEDEAEEEAGASRLMHQDGESSLTERRPLNEEDEEPIMKRSSSIDVEEFSEEAGDKEAPEEEEPEEMPSVTDPHDVNEKRKRLFEALADKDDDEAGGRTNEKILFSSTSRYGDECGVSHNLYICHDVYVRSAVL